MVDREQIGIRIAALRKKAGLSQTALAERLGISAQAVSKWESGRNLPDIDLFCELAWLFDMTIDSIVEGGLSFTQSSGGSMLPANVAALVPEPERRKLLLSFAPYCSDTELYSIARELADGNLELSLAASIRRKEEKTENAVFIPMSALGKSTLRETAPYFSKALGKMMGNMEPGLRRIAGLMRCPKCGEKLFLKSEDENRIYFECKNSHQYHVTDGVVYFGTREIRGELWSLFLRNYQDYLLQHYYPGNPRYQMGKVPCSEVRWQAIKKLQPRIILDIACGTCNGLKYDLQRINWPCLVIMTDLSHRVLKPGGHAVYNMSVVGDHSSENTRKWERLYRTLDESCYLHDTLFDIEEWKEICRQTGYLTTDAREIYGELPAPEEEVFPFENEVLQWMGEYLCVSEK